MAVKIACADGNLTTAGTWATVDSTSFSDSVASTAAVTTSYQESTAFAPGAITIDGIAVKVSSRPGSTGTMSVRLAQAGSTVAGTEVTINVADISSRDGEQGWYFFKFAAPVTLSAATNYTVSIKASNNTQVRCYITASTNWSRMLRTTTTGAPGAGDSMHILGEWTAAGTKTDRAVTMDSTVNTDYGDGTPANQPGFTIGKGGSLTWGVTAATNYILRVSTSLCIWHGGTMSMGTTGSPIPRDSSHELQFDCAAADGDYGLIVYGTLNCQGQSRTSGKDISQCLLNTDEAVASTSLGVDTDTGWLSGDDIAIASTTRTLTQAEVRTLNGAAGASSLDITAGLTNAHSGTSPTQAEVILLSRNCRILSTSSTFMSYITLGNASVSDFDWTLFRYLGGTASGKRGVEILTTNAAGGSVNMNHCCAREFDNWGVVFAVNAVDNITITNFVGYKIGMQSTAQIALGHITGLTSLTSTSITLTDITIISNNGTNAGGLITLRCLGNTVLQRARLSCGGGTGLAIDTSNNDGPLNGTISDIVCHSTNQGGIEIVRTVGRLRMDNLTLWRCNTGSTRAGLVINRIGPTTFYNLKAFGNGNNNVLLDSTNFVQSGGPLTFRLMTLSGDSSFATNVGLAYNSSSEPSQIRIENSTFGQASGIFVAHATSDIDLDPTGVQPKGCELTLVNVLLDKTTLANQSSWKTNSAIRYQRVQQVTNTHKTVYPALGTVEYDTSVFHNAAPSEKLSPSGATVGQKLCSKSRFKVAVSGVPVVIGVWVRKSAAYTGNAPRLILKANPALGILDDIVAATHAAAADTWEQLTYTTAAPSENGAVEFYVDCDGSAGAVYTDDWS